MDLAPVIVQRHVIGEGELAAQHLTVHGTHRPQRCPCWPDAPVSGLVMGIVGMTAGFVGAVLGGLDAGDSSGVAATVLWGLFLTSMASLFGLGVDMASSTARWPPRAC